MQSVQGDSCAVEHVYTFDHKIIKYNTKLFIHYSSLSNYTFCLLESCHLFKSDQKFYDCRSDHKSINVFNKFIHHNKRTKNLVQNILNVTYFGGAYIKAYLIAGVSYRDPAIFVDANAYNMRYCIFM